MRKIRTTDIGKMTCDLMSHLFSTQEIACSSRTGKKNNMKSVDSAVEKKKPLNQNYKFNAIKGKNDKEFSLYLAFLSYN